MVKYHFGKSFASRWGRFRICHPKGHPAKREKSLTRKIAAHPAMKRMAAAKMLYSAGAHCHRSRINTGDSAFPRNTSGDAFGVPRLCCLLRCLLTSSLQFSWLPSSLASLLLLSWLPLFLFSLCRVDIEPARDTLQLTNV
jgi:hypothetical protein